MQRDVCTPAESGANYNAKHAADRAGITAEHAGASCCAPTGHAAFLVAPPSGAAVTISVVSSGLRHLIEQAVIPAQTFRMGDSRGDENSGDGETPVHEVSLTEFSIDATSVTNDDFARFVDSTGYRTEAEAWGFRSEERRVGKECPV